MWAEGQKRGGTPECRAAALAVLVPYTRRPYMRVGSVDLGCGIVLAPMEAVTDLSFRTVCEEQGASITFTEFLSAEALTRGAEKAVSRMWPSYEGRPFVVQIFGRDPSSLARAADMAAQAGASIVDINMGCPAKKVTSGMCGSALMPDRSETDRSSDPR